MVGKDIFIATTTIIIVVMIVTKASISKNIKKIMEFNNRHIFYTL